MNVKLECVCVFLDFDAYCLTSMFEVSLWLHDCVITYFCLMFAYPMGRNIVFHLNSFLTLVQICVVDIVVIIFVIANVVFLV